MKVFWSWQDDSPGKTNRHFIKAALEEAVRTIGDDYQAEDADRPELDHDTKGVAGAKEIVPTLMAKIARSAVFVADVTPVGTTSKEKPLPNPNVMVELGWSLNKPGDGRQIYVLNTADGWKIEQLPFDIRHRRVLTYSLAESADNKIRERVKKELVKDLTSAITAILNEHLDEQAQSTPALGIAAKTDEPSIWAGGETGFRHMDSMRSNYWQEVAIPAGARAYLRVIPSGWNAKPPTAAQIRKVDFENAPIVFSRYTSGDFGATKDGYVRYWISSTPGAELASEDLSMYFEETGEFWLLHGSAVYEARGRRILNFSGVFEVWASALRRAHWVLDAKGAKRARRVELGFTGIENVHFPGEWFSESPPSRRDVLQLDETRRDWSEPTTQQAFLAKALDEIFGLFGLDPQPSAATSTFLRQNDRELLRQNPYADQLALSR